MQSAQEVIKIMGIETGTGLSKSTFSPSLLKYKNSSKVLRYANFSTFSVLKPPKINYIGKGWPSSQKAGDSLFKSRRKIEI